MSNGKRKKCSSPQTPNSYGIPPWKTGAAFLFRPLFRVFPRGDSVVKAAAKRMIDHSTFSGTDGRTRHFKLTR